MRTTTTVKEQIDKLDNKINQAFEALADLHPSDPYQGTIKIMIDEMEKELQTLYNQ